MHRETNLQVENEETIEAQSARTPKRCWTESNSAFSFACTDSFDGASARVTATSRVCVRTASFPRFARPPFSVSGDSFANAAQSCTGASGLPGWRARNASVTLGFRRPCGRENGRQFSYKHNAEEGVRLDEQRSTVDRGRRGGTRRPFVMGCAVGHRGVSRAVPRPVCAFPRPRGSLRSHRHPRLRPYSHERPVFRCFTRRGPGRSRPVRAARRSSMQPQRSLARSRISSLSSS